MTKLFLSPHNDDAVLFGAFTIQRERPLVMTVFDSQVQANRGHRVTATQRRAEDEAAMQILGQQVSFCGFSDARLVEQELEEYFRFFSHLDEVYAPAVEEGGHPHHNLIGAIAARIWPGRVLPYLTYTSSGKSRSAKEVHPASGEHVRRKLHALACYESQIDIEALGCRPHFLNDLHEYYA